jgi:hypothetical protein
MLKKIWVCNWFRALKKALGSYYFPRVQLDLSNATWGKLIDGAFGHKLNPPFNPYDNTLNFVLGMYTLPYVGLTGYVGTSPLLHGAGAKAVLTYLLFPFLFLRVSQLTYLSELKMFCPLLGFKTFVPVKVDCKITSIMLNIRTSLR